MYKIDEFSKKYNSGFRMEVKGLTLNHGVTAVLGHVGQGKTTLLRVMSGLSRVSTGEITFINNTIFKPDQTTMYKFKVDKLGLIYKDFIEEFDYEKYLELLNQFGIDSTEHYTSLSSGQKEVVCVLLTICVDRDIYLLDEPFSNIDVINRKKISDLIISNIDLSKKTVLIASHEISYLDRLIDQCILLKDGIIIGNETVEKINEEYPTIKEWYSNLYKLES